MVDWKVGSEFLEIRIKLFEGIDEKSYNLTVFWKTSKDSGIKYKNGNHIGRFSDRLDETCVILEAEILAEDEDGCWVECVHDIYIEKMRWEWRENDKYTTIYGNNSPNSSSDSIVFFSV